MSPSSIIYHEIKPSGTVPVNCRDCRFPALNSLKEEEFDWSSCQKITKFAMVSVSALLFVP